MTITITPSTVARSLALSKGERDCLNWQTKQIGDCQAASCRHDLPFGISWWGTHPENDDVVFRDLKEHLVWALAPGRVPTSEEEQLAEREAERRLPRVYTLLRTRAERTSAQHRREAEAEVRKLRKELRLQRMGL